MRVDTLKTVLAHHFGLIAPTTYKLLKQAYRVKVKLLHPDVSGGQHDAFVKMQNAYDILCKFTSVEIFADATESLAAVDGTLLSELGLGLGPTRNGKDCPECQHQGYKTEKNVTNWTICEVCDRNGQVPVKLTCKACKGSGKFTQARSQKVVTCLKCKGVGFTNHQTATHACTVCKGTKSVEVPGKDRHYRCWRCHGTGEIEIHNPVLPKGRLAALGLQ